MKHLKSYSIQFSLEKKVLDALKWSMRLYKYVLYILLIVLKIKNHKKSPMDVRKSLYEAILISGGTTMFPGFPTRLLNDVNRDYKNKILKGKEGSGKVKINVLVIYIFNKIFTLNY